MMIKSRIEKLEQRHALACDECRTPPPIRFCTVGAGEPDPPGGAANCPKCGRHLDISLTILVAPESGKGDTCQMTA